MESKYNNKMKKLARKHGVCDECSTDIYHLGAWTSMKLGLFLCQECAGIHRGLGTHISFVKSVNLDVWSKDHYRIFLAAKKRDLNRSLEVAMPQGEKPGSESSHRAKKKFIKNKHVRRLYFQDISDDVEEDCDRSESVTSNRLDESREAPLLDFGIQSESDEPLLTFNDKSKHNEFDFGEDWDFPAKATFSQAQEKSKQADAFNENWTFPTSASDNNAETEESFRDIKPSTDAAIGDILRLFQKPPQSNQTHNYFHWPYLA